MADRSASGGYSLKNKDGDQMINSLRMQPFLFAARLRFPPGIPWAPEDIFFLSILILRGEAASRRREVSREPYKPVSTVYFILGILRTDLWSQGTSGKATQNIVICQCLADQLFAEVELLGQIIDILAIDKSLYFAWPRLIIRSHVVT